MLARTITFDQLLTGVLYQLDSISLVSGMPKFSGRSDVSFVGALLFIYAALVPAANCSQLRLNEAQVWVVVSCALRIGRMASKATLQREGVPYSN